MVKIFIILLISLLLTSCSKYEDGIFSFKSAETRLEGDVWYSETLISGGVERDIQDNYSVEFDPFSGKEGIYVFTSKSRPYKGSVSLEENKTRLVFFEIDEYLTLDTITSSILNSWTINKLSSRKFWIETNIENIDVEIKFYRH